MTDIEPTSKDKKDAAKYLLGSCEKRFCYAVELGFDPNKETYTEREVVEFLCKKMLESVE